MIETANMSAQDPAHPAHRRRNKAKVLIAMSFATVFAAFGDVSLSRGMKLVGAGHHHGFWETALAIANTYVIAGILLLMAFLALYLASLSWEDMSFVLPLTAADYVLVTLLARVWLHEDVSPVRWAGTLLVAIGIAFVTRS